MEAPNPRPNRAMNSRNTILDAASLIEPASNPKVEHKSRGFLRELNSGGATPLEQLSLKEARGLLAALQASAPHNGASRGTGSNSCRFANGCVRPFCAGGSIYPRSDSHCVGARG